MPVLKSWWKPEVDGESVPPIVRFGSVLIFARAGLTLVLCSMAAQQPLPPVLHLKTPPVDALQWREILVLALAAQLLQLYCGVRINKLRLATWRLFMTAELTTCLGALAAAASGMSMAWSVAGFSALCIAIFGRFEVRHHFAVHEYLLDLQGRGQPVTYLYDGYQPKEPTAPLDHQSVGYVVGLGAINQ